MRHIKTKLLVFIISAVLLSTLVTNAVSILLLRNLYLQELYTTSESTAKQILLTTDSTVKTVESSMTLIFDSRGINSLLTQTNFKEETGELFLAIQDLDSIMDNFKIQFPDFNALLFCSSSGGMYRYQYFNDSLINYINRLSAGERDRWTTAENFRWEGVYKIGNQLSPPDQDEAYVVTKTVTNPANLRYAGLAVAFLEPDLFSSNFVQSQNKTGGRAILLDGNGRPTAGYQSVDLMLIAETRERMTKNNGSTQQFLTEDGSQIATAVRSEVTGWTLLYIMPLQLLTERMNTAIWLGCIIAVAILCITAAFVYRYVTILSDSIEKVSHAMSKVGSNDFSLRLQTNRTDEIGEIYAGFNAMSQNLNHLFERTVEEEREKKEAEIRALIYQIKPHFLYNTLASIRMNAMMEGSDRIAEMLATLNRLLRNTINIGDKPISVADELANLQDYISIYRLRYKDCILFSVEPEEDTLSLMIPNMLIQPIVENAIEHGFASSISNPGYQCTVKVRIFRKDGALYIQVEDNGDGMSDMVRRRILAMESGESRQGHIGLRNIHERLQSLFGGDYGVSVESEKNRFTRVTLRVFIEPAHTVEPLVE